MTRGSIVDQLYRFANHITGLSRDPEALRRLLTHLADTIAADESNGNRTASHYHVIQDENFVSRPKCCRSSALDLGVSTQEPWRIVPCNAPINGEFCDATLRGLIIEPKAMP